MSRAFFMKLSRANLKCHGHFEKNVSRALYRLSRALFCFDLIFFNLELSKRPFFENLISKRAFFKFSNGKKKPMTRKKKPGYISWWLKISDKKPLVCHGHFWLCHGQNFRNCHRRFSFVTGMFWPILSRATRPVSRAKFGVFCHGHFYKVTGTFSTNVTGKPKSVTGKKKTLHFSI